MRRYDVITEICDAMLALGWEPYQNDHEDANGQFEMNWDYGDALVTADRHAFFKYMVKLDGREARPARDLHAQALRRSHRQWLPRPCLALGRRQRNLFDDPEGELGLSALGYQFLGGILHSADALARSSIRRSTPTSASTRRARVSGATWSPSRSPIPATTAPT